MNFTSECRQASLAELKQGYRYHADRKQYECLFCGQIFIKGHIYPAGESFLDAETAVGSHIAQTHGAVFHILLGLDKQHTGLTALQRDLLTRFYAGESDSEIVSALTMGSRSTIRNHRFALRERMKQARFFLAIMELLEERTASRNMDSIESPMNPDRVARLPRKLAKRTALAQAAAARFIPGRRYSREDLCAILEEFCEDHAGLRRWLVDCGILDREADGSWYWLKESSRTKDVGMDKKNLKITYKFADRPMGVYQIKNRANGKVLVGSSMNLDGRRNRFGFEVKHGSIANDRAIRQDWEQYGAENFEFEVLELLKPGDDPDQDYRGALAALEQAWLDKLQPYGDRGYNRVLPTGNGPE